MGLLMNLLDRIISWAAPERFVHRQLARMASSNLARTEQLVGYRESSPTARDWKVHAQGASPDWSLELGFDRRDNVDRARELERRNSIAASVLDRACEHVVGEGFKLKCKTSSKEWNKKAEEYWDDWCRHGADSRGMMTFNEMLTIAFRSWLRDGDVGLLLEKDGTIRLVESDEIASKTGGYFKPSDADGVELDSKGRIKAFYVFDYDPSILWPDRRRAIPRLVRVPAKDMIFLARRLRAGQTRGISAFAGAHWIFETMDDCIEANAVAHHMAAAAGLVIAKKNAMPGTPVGRGGELKMGPGKILRVEPGEEVTPIQPEHPGGTFEMLIHTLVRMAAARFGMSLELVNYDFTDANYSNMRAQSLETAIACRIKQRGFLEHACSNVWLWLVAKAIEEGKLPPNREAFKHAWGVAGTPWQDPEVELRAAMGSVDGALDTRRQILARRGLDFDEVIEELAEEQEKMKKLKLPDIRSNLTRDAVPTTKTISDEPANSRPKPGQASKNGHGGRLRALLS
jgi:lambda family phage portal protein